MQQDEVGLGLVVFDAVPAVQNVQNAVSFVGDQVSGFFDVFDVGEHQASGDFGQGVDGPGVLSGVDFADQIHVAGDGVAKTKAGGGEEFGGTAQDDQVGVVVGQGDSGYRFDVRDEFHVGFVDHDENAVHHAGIEDTTHVFGGYGGGGRVVWVAEYE